MVQGILVKTPISELPVPRPINLKSTTNILYRTIYSLKKHSKVFYNNFICNLCRTILYGLKITFNLNVIFGV